MQGIPNRNVKRNKGQSIVEVALTLPLLVLLLAGLVETAFIARNYLMLLEIGREAARLGARGESLFDNDEILTLVRHKLAQENASSQLVDVIILRADVGPGKQLNEYKTSSMLGSDEPAQLSPNTLLNRLNGADPHSRLIGVEIYFDHQSVLGFPLVSDIFPDPFTLHTYSIMRLVQ